MQTKFYFLKISCPKSDDNGFFFRLIESIKNNNIVNHSFYNVPYNLDKASQNDIFILQIGGDVSDKRKYFKDCDLKNFENGIYALASITNINITNKTVSAEVYPFTKHVSKLDLLLFPQFIDNIGLASKGIPNQAGLYDIQENIAFSFFDYLSINNLSGQSKNLINKFNCKDQLKNVTKQFIERLDIKSINTFHTYSDVLIDENNNKNNTQYEKQRVRIFSSFIEWFNKPENFSKSYIGLVTIDNLIFWDETYFSKKLCIIDPNNIERSITQISNNILNNTNEEWIAFNESTSRGAPKAIIGRNNFLKFLYENFDDINNLLDHEKSTTIFNEQFDVNKFGKAINESGLIYSNFILSRFIASLATKPFVLLTGLSGSGKTKLAQSFAQWICDNKSQYCIVPVGADWTNREPLLGYVDALNKSEYVVPENRALQLLIDANKQENQDQPYFLILDEMNLSHVERYFADFLSVMESKETFQLHSDIDNFKTGVPHELSWPQNLFVIGTVNIDETTYMFSPKVLDRSNVIEFRVGESEIEEYLKENKEVTNLKGEGSSMAKSFVGIATSSDSKKSVNLNKTLVEFFSELQKVGAEFGYRTASEIQILFAKLDVVNPVYSEMEKEKIDIAVMQKLLPKLHGSRRKLCPVLEVLAEFCVDYGDKESKDKVMKKYFDFKDEIQYDNNPEIKYPISLEKILRMYKGAIDNGFVSYAEA